MFYAINWFLVLCLLVLWSLAAWMFHAIAAWTSSNAGGLAGASGGFRIPDWMAPWMPPELGLALDAMVSAFTPVFDAVLGWAPALAGGLSVAVWVVWGIGTVLLIVSGFVVTGLIALLRRRASVPSTPMGVRVAAR